jgi:hypothetical protein
MESVQAKQIRKDNGYGCQGSERLPGFRATDGLSGNDQFFSPDGLAIPANDSSMDSLFQRTMSPP